MTENRVYVPGKSSLCIEFMLTPEPQLRGTIGRSHNGRPMIYKNQKTSSYQQAISIIAKAHMHKLGLQPMQGAIATKIEFMFQPPKSKMRAWERDKIEFMHTVKPDIDNLEKALNDGCNGIVWHDDAQIVLCLKHKRYDHAPRIILTVYDATETLNLIDLFNKV